MPDVQIPQVIREFITGERGQSRNGNPIGAWSWTEAAQAGQRGLGCSEQSPWEEERTVGMEPMGSLRRGLLPPCSQGREGRLRTRWLRPG